MRHQRSGAFLTVATGTQHQNTNVWIVRELLNDLIGVLVLGASGDRKKGPGPLVTQLSRSAGALPVPITIVPGDLSKERLEAIT